MKRRNGFELLATAPDGVPRLRELILSLAVQGKLVQQDSTDEPASKILDQLGADRLTSRGPKASRTGEVLKDAGNEAFHAPVGWEWAPFDLVVECLNGYAFKSEWFRSEGVRLVRNANVSHGHINWEQVACLDTETAAEFERFALEAGDIVLSLDRPIISSGLKCAEIKADDLPCLLLQRVAKLTPRAGSITRPFLKMWLASPYFTELLDPGRSNGVPHISTKQIGAIRIALPPLAEQARIVAKVDQLMQLCDELETRGRLESAQHARLTATLFDALGSSESAHALAENWARVAAHFDLLLDRPEAVDVLEQTILQLAVRGLLLPQESNDEPASDLLQQIRTEKDRLIAEGKVKRDKPLPAITEDDKPFELPEQWEWVRTQDICAVITDGDHQAPPKAAAGVPFLVIGDVRWGSLDVASASRFVPDSYFDGLDWSKKPIAGDILYTTVGSFGIPVLVTEEMRFCFQRHIGLFRPAHITLQPFLNLVLASALVLQQASARATGIAQKTVPLSALRDFKIPLPPLAEQHRIVVRVEDLSRLCADLRARLAARQTCQTRFAEALVGQMAPTASLATRTDDLAAAA
ncbi:restriction endonuclease subunit S [Paraburkholderia xenovorans]|uniref:restriction endonuclease subunit S n=1 Tax=Paraburkholderia xenovorans TaxID=36873 RepID=UPI0038BABC6C